MAELWHVLAVMTGCFGDGFCRDSVFTLKPRYPWPKPGVCVCVRVFVQLFSASSWGYFTKFSIPEEEEAWDIRVLRYHAISVNKLWDPFICVSKMAGTYSIIVQSHDRKSRVPVGMVIWWRSGLWRDSLWVGSRSESKRLFGETRTGSCLAARDLNGFHVTRIVLCALTSVTVSSLAFWWLEGNHISSH